MIILMWISINDIDNEIILMMIIIMMMILIMTVW